jgi:hypothetical protein
MIELNSKLSDIPLLNVGWSINLHALLKSTGLVDSNSPQRDLNSLPPNLPVPQDDGACDHLLNAKFPKIVLQSTADRELDLAKQSLTPTVLFFYPRTGEPHKPAPADCDLTR